MSNSVDKLFIRYGSLISSGVSELLYDKILDDPELVELFQGVDMDDLAIHMGDLLSVITGGPDLYKGQRIDVAHSGLNITAMAFHRMMQYFRESMDELDIESEDAELVLEVLLSSESEVVSA
jgi:truncated hemoglobin YjbI